MKTLNEIDKELNYLEGELFRISQPLNKSNIKEIYDLYKDIQVIKRDLLKVIPTKDTVEDYSYIKYKILEDEINIKILIKEKLGIDTKNEYLEMEELVA